MAEEPTCLFFPLRTSVELFRDPSSPAPALRAKQGAVLYDSIGFEAGAYAVTMAGGGFWQEWRPADHLTDEELTSARQIHEEGEPFALSVGVQPAKGVPASPESMRTVLQGPVARHYVAEWESVFRQLRPLDPDWAFLFPVTDPHLQASGLDAEIRRLDFDCLNERLQPGPEGVLRNWTLQALNRDKVVAASLDAALNVTSLFLPAIERDGAEPITAGQYALEVVAPNLEKLPWEVVCEFRDHAGCREAREKLREFERRALESEPADVMAFQLRLGQEITRDYMLAFQDMRPSLGVDVVRQALTTTVSTFVPVVGPMSSLMETKYRQLEHRRSWRTALMKLT